MASPAKVNSTKGQGMELLVQMKSMLETSVLHQKQLLDRLCAVEAKVIEQENLLKEQQLQLNLYADIPKENAKLLNKLTAQVTNHSNQLVEITNSANKQIASLKDCKNELIDHEKRFTGYDNILNNRTNDLMDKTKHMG